MGKTKTRPPAAPTEVAVTYDLLDLPTAFHKAGLAGLVLLIESLEERGVLDRCELRRETTPAGATVTFTPDGLRKLMDDLYDAQVVEVASKSKWSGATPKREETVEETVDGKPVRTKRFVYDQVQPRGTFYDNVFDGAKEIWRKLWRDMLWNIPRGRPTTREPYNQRAAGATCKEGPAAWVDLEKVAKARAKNGFHTAALSSALLPGAQAVNAEGVGFEGRAEHNLLLHFWPLTARLFVPQEVERDGTTNLPPASYAVVVPDVSDLQAFVEDYPRLLAALTPDPRGYRPAQAVIDLPAEGALAVLDNLAELSGLDVAEGELRLSVGGLEFLLLTKAGNNVKAMATGRVSPDRRLLVGYRELAQPKDKSVRYANPLFRRGLLAALLGDRAWFQPFGDTFAKFDAEVFVRRPRANDEKGPPQFATDAAKKFRHEIALHAKKLERYSSMPDAPRPAAPPAVIVNRVVRSYLLARTQEKSGVKLDAFAGDADKVDWSAVPAEFNEAKNKLALGLILEFRSRRDQAFADHFAATFFSVTQRVAEPDRVELAALLTDPARRDDLKTLTLLSLSANS